MRLEQASGKTALDNRDRIDGRIRHKQVFFNAAFINHEAHLANELLLIAENGENAELRTDYAKMLGAGMGYNNPPSFTTSSLTFVKWSMR
ncbi:hypothetical protein [Thiohalobacter thiocyanaticus]|nr:hypothetical protein [Thiohalobacter thiocyanaticus]